MTIDWEQIRRTEYSTLDKNNMLYFMAASASPLSRSAYESAVSYFKSLRKSGDIHFEDFTEAIEEARKIIAVYINCKPEEIAFLINTSSGMAVLAELFAREKGEILYPSAEFPASIHIFKRNNYPCTKVEDSLNSYPIENFKVKTNDSTKFVVHSFVQSLTGFKQDLNELGEYCNQNDMISIINATQAFGSFKIDVKKSNIAALVSNGLKWLGCGYGIGILYIREDILEDRELPFSGWLSVDDPFSMDNDNLNVIKKVSSMDAFGGCPNCAALFSLKGGLDLIKNKMGAGDIKQGVNNIERRILSLTTELVNKLEELNLKIITPLDLKYRSGIITIEHEQAKGLHQSLRKNNAHLSLKKYPKQQDDTLLRFAVNHYNNLDDIEKVSELLKRNMRF